MAFGKTNFAMLLGSGPSKKFNMQSLFQDSPEWPLSLCSPWVTGDPIIHSKTLKQKTTLRGLRGWCALVRPVLGLSEAVSTA
jgi:hypothetical protein